mmetsp:Transcript_47423/g.113789  ORF Transcript_47423/g.113789 Transcript_47423/m.113789 type:complete len:101 (+) Transcript_47423:62-364(+)
MSASPEVTITSCALGGHLLGRGGAVRDELQKQLPAAKVTNKVGCPLQFSIAAGDEQVLGGLAGTCTILKLLLCCTGAEDVAEEAAQEIAVGTNSSAPFGA